MAVCGVFLQKSETSEDSESKPGMFPRSAATLPGIFHYYGIPGPRNREECGLPIATSFTVQEDRFLSDVVENLTNKLSYAQITTLGVYRLVTSYQHVPINLIFTNGRQPR